MALRLTTSLRLLSRRDRTLGNSILQSGASLGAILTPLVIQLMVSDRPGSWRAPFQVIGAAGIVWALAWLVLVRERDLALAEGPGAGGGTGPTEHPGRIVPPSCGDSRSWSSW